MATKKSKKTTLYAFAMCTMIKDTFKDLSADGDQFIKAEGSNFYTNKTMFQSLEEAITAFCALSNCEDGNSIEIQPLRKKEAVLIIQQGEVKNSAVFIKVVYKDDKSASTYVSINDITKIVSSKKPAEEAAASK